MNLNGQIIITPSQAIETYQGNCARALLLLIEAINPADEIAGLKWNIQQLVQWPKLASNLKQQWLYLYSHLIGESSSLSIVSDFFQHCLMELCGMDLKYCFQHNLGQTPLQIEKILNYILFSPFVFSLNLPQI